MAEEHGKDLELSLWELLFDIERKDLRFKLKEEQKTAFCCFLKTSCACVRSFLQNYPLILETCIKRAFAAVFHLFELMFFMTY